MTLHELKARVDMAYKDGRYGNLEVVIPNNKITMGGISTTKVKGASRGIDWNNGNFIIWPENEMIEKPQAETK